MTIYESADRTCAIMQTFRKGLLLYGSAQVAALYVRREKCIMVCSTATENMWKLLLPPERVVTPRQFISTPLASYALVESPTMLSGVKGKALTDALVSSPNVWIMASSEVVAFTAARRKRLREILGTKFRTLRHSELLDKRIVVEPPAWEEAIADMDINNPYAAYFPHFCYAKLVMNDRVIHPYLQQRVSEEFANPEYKSKYVATLHALMEKDPHEWAILLPKNGKPFRKMFEQEFPAAKLIWPEEFPSCGKKHTVFVATKEIGVLPGFNQNMLQLAAANKKAIETTLYSVEPSNVSSLWRVRCW
ncbi:unknown [Singapore grouper iridovirus]|uniref:Uncharacterized protein n=1 Tax=Singapore grouper iridovirus TaxID=262968 RepID=Q5YFR4_9VIRU|nr:hypothetical protein ORF001L [Singapore grouper iridovirus]AAS18016.1 unknown [Singapore grouper iridovirus]WAU86710.1 hypothetical protein ORF001L [Singapore grouper iridovirus]